MTTTATNQQDLKQLKEFVQKAEKLGKYPHNTSVGMLGAIKVVEDGLVPEEPSTMDYLNDHLEEVFHRQMDRINLTSQSVQTYIARVRRAIGDFESYGRDPKALLAWKPRVVQRASRSRKDDSKPEIPIASPADSYLLHAQQTALSGSANLKNLVWSLRHNLNIMIQLPTDLNVRDVERLNKLLRLEAELSGNEGQAA
jgi:hypothetical protein